MGQFALYTGRLCGVGGEKKGVGVSAWIARCKNKAAPVWLLEWSFPE